VREVIEKTAAKGAAGIFYWGGCYLGVEGKVQSAWENQALFDPNGKALPSLNVMNVRGK
jgi:arabinogalactan endo-1,4-beta-galactosidase